MARAPGQPIQMNNAAEFFSGVASGRVLAPGGDGGSVAMDAQPVAGIGESAIAMSERLRRNTGERGLAGAPKFWKVRNRAQQGHVQVWMGVFSGEAYPDGAVRDDKSTWLQPGDEMMLPLDAALHFFGNVFDPRLPEAMEIIERCGGFELETQVANPGRNAEVRVIGGPIGLPDFVIVPLDGRTRPIGNGIELYPLYWNAVRKRVLKTRKDKNPDVIEAEKLLLAERIREYTLEEDPDAGVLFDGSGKIVSTSATRAEAAEEDLPDMKDAPTEEEVEISARRRR